MKRVVPFAVVFAGGLIAAIAISCSGDKGGLAAGHFTFIPVSKSGIKFSNILSNSEYFNIYSHPGFYDGGGVAVGDINNDGLPDLYFVSNQWDNKLYLNKGNFEFEDITTKAGVAGTGNWKTTAIIKDANNDGKPDIYVRGYRSNNQYVNTADQVFLNNGDLTFTKSSELFGLDTLALTPGRAEGDINNDGLMDVMLTGAFPYDEAILHSTSLQPPNQLLINQGNNLFTDIAWYAGVAATDKSWTPLLADFDGDGKTDIFITTGVPGRVNDLRYLQDSVRQKEGKLPSGAVPNFIFRQTGDLRFEDVTEAWIGKTPGISNGAVLADLDNDGDPDIVVNNINGEAFIMRNDIADQRNTSGKQAKPVDSPLLQRVKAISFKHNEDDFNSLISQPLIPFSNATRGPKIAVGDINGDKLDDLFINGGQNQAAVVYIQTRAGKFIQVPQPAFEADKTSEGTCATFFDVDGDKDLDLLVGSGGEEFLDKRLLLNLYINNGLGTFMKAEGLKRADIVSSLQKIYVNASCLVPADVDNDGDMDVFVGGGTVTGRYGVDSDSFILLNDGQGMLTEGPMVFENRQRPGGMVQAAAWTDLDGDKFPELITAGEWMPITMWKNDSSTLRRMVGNGLDSTFGWWHSMVIDDLDSDGDIDIIAGNFGLNGRLHPSVNQPLELIVSDVDKNGRHDPLMFHYPGGEKYSVPVTSPFGTRIDTKIVAQRRVTSLESAWFENNGKGQFTRHVLPGPAQLFPVMAIHVSDIDHDGKKDIILVGNLKAVQPELGRQDTGQGLILLGGKEPRSLHLPGEGRDVKMILNANKEQLFIVTRNNDSLIVFKKK